MPLSNKLGHDEINSDFEDKLGAKVQQRMQTGYIHSEAVRPQKGNTLGNTTGAREQMAKQFAKAMSRSVRAMAGR